MLHRMRRRTLFIIAGSVVAGLVAALTAVYAAADRSPDDAVSVHSTQNPSDVATYWTQERLRKAKGA
jgi:hypothetical protein